MKISLVTITLDRSKYLTRMLSHMCDYVDEIIVVDGGSVDDTVEVSKKFGANVCYREFDGNFSKQFNFGLEKASSEWMLVLGDDEFLEYPLCKFMRKMAEKNEDICYFFSRKNYFRCDGTECAEENYDLFNWPDYSLRFFKRGLSFRERLHEEIDPSGRPVSHVDPIYGSIIHEKSMKQQLESNKLYSNIEIGAYDGIIDIKQRRQRVKDNDT